jgi:glyoxylase-like metal-dependent hydrolase (beta-lactamase superfamily II)
VQRGEWVYATHTNERTAGSYFPHNFAPIACGRCFDFVDGEREIVRGIRVVPTPGHTPFHQSVLIQSDGETGVLSGGSGATASHLPLAWIMGYDVEPLVTLETKRAMLTKAAHDGWLMIFEHDATVASGRVKVDGKGFVLA